MLSNPKITVLMPVYNCELYIKEALDSILNQTFSDFEFIIIDDASTDSTVSLIRSYNDARIYLVEKSLNTGLTNSLNHGLSIAKGEYIARMDGDDISLPERFARQVAFLDKNPEVIVCGSNFRFIGTQNVTVLPQENEKIKLRLLKGNCIAHPSVMMRKQVLEEFKVVYNIEKEPAEDFDLWVRLLAIGKLHNLQEVLLNYRVHNTQISKKQEIKQNQIALQSRLKMLDYLDYSFNKIQEDLLKKIFERNLSITFNEIKAFSVLKDKMILANLNNFFDYIGFQEYLDELQRQNLISYFVFRKKYCPIVFFQYFAIREKSVFKLRLVDELKLMIKSMISFERR